MMAQMNLVVFAGCYTAQDGPTYTSISSVASADGANNTIGWTGATYLPVTTADDTGTYGDAWANTFWSDLGAGATFGTALVDGSNAVANLYGGNAYGWNTYVWRQWPGTASTLYPAQYGQVQTKPWT